MSILTRVIFDPDVTPPSVPLSVAASVISSTSLRASWGVATDTGGAGLAGYRVLRSTSPAGPFVQIGSDLSTASTTFDDTGLSASTTYYYRVIAFDGNGNQSGPSAVASATTQPPPVVDDVFVPPSAVSYLPAIANARGFGMDTSHGLGSRSVPNATVLTVDRLTASSSDGSGTSGSLAWCLTRSFPRIIEFGVSGTISMSGAVNVFNDNFYVAGETAPSPGIFIRQGNFNLVCGHGVMSHLNAYMGDDAGSPAQDIRDCFQASANSHHIVFANCSAFWGCDETLHIYNSAGDCTVWQCLIAEPLDQMSLVSEFSRHGFGLLVSAGTSSASPPRVSILRNSFSLGFARLPLTSSPSVQIADNIVYNWGRATSPSAPGHCMQFRSTNNVATDSNVEGNLFLRGPDNPGLTSPIQSNDQTSIGVALQQGSRLFQTNNKVVGLALSLIDNAAGITGWTQGSRISGAWAQGYNVTRDVSWADADFVDLHSRNVGACPRYTTGRRALQFQFMQNWLSGLTGNANVGQIRDHVADAGGWGSIPAAGVIQNSLSHTASGAHNGDPRPTGSAINQVMPSGYTRMEEWLHRRYAEQLL